jgi:hypothetical protein
MLHDALKSYMVDEFIFITYSLKNALLIRTGTATFIIDTTEMIFKIGVINALDKIISVCVTCIS